MKFRYLFFTLTFSLINFSSGQNVTTTTATITSVQPAKNESLPASTTSVPTVTTTLPVQTTALPPLISTNDSNKALDNATRDNSTTEESSGGSILGSFFSILSPLVPAHEIGSNCSTQSDCKINGSICLESKCSCSNEFVVSWNNRECLRKATALGDGCIEDSQCKISLEKTVGSVMCLSQKCGCGPDATYIEKENKCVSAHSELGSNCEADASCIIPNSICTQNVCACKPDMLPSPENDRCIPATKKLGGSCTDDAQCQEDLGDFSLCEDGFCNCKPNYHSNMNSTQCLTDIELGAACSHPEECMTHLDGQMGASRDCVKGVCVCMSVSCREQAGLKSTSNGVTNYFQLSLLTVILFNCFS